MANKIRDFLLGFILSFTSWETWKNIILSLLIAFVGGILSAAGKMMYNRIYRSIQTKKAQKSKITLYEKT